MTEYFLTREQLEDGFLGFKLGEGYHALTVIVRGQVDVGKTEDVCQIHFDDEVLKVLKAQITPNK